MSIYIDSEMIEFLRKNGHFPEKYFILNELNVPNCLKDKINENERLSNSLQKNKHFF